MSRSERRTVEGQATQFLRSRGYTWGGRQKGTTPPGEQFPFERRLIRTAPGGMRGRYKGHRAQN